VQCRQYLPEDADPELAESIEAWKDEWKTTRDQLAARRQHSFDTSSIGTSMEASYLLR